MSEVGQIERTTQNRVVDLFEDKLEYKYLGSWEERLGNSNIEEELLVKYLKSKNIYSEAQINKAIFELKKAANNLNEGLYNANKEVYKLLRYGISVKTEVGENYETVHIIDWKNPLKNDFYIAEEVTILGNREKRPDIVLYVNGIALGVIELKRSTISIGDGIRQNITNQRKDFIEPFFSTIQYVFAGNDTEGLRYGSIKTEEKYYLRWKEQSSEENLLDKYLLKLCDKERFLEIIYHFALFDGGIKKLCRPHQYFAVKAAQEYVQKREGGIIWHTQGSGKSLVMVWLAKWILENNPNARVVIITDRDELDKQIKQVFIDVGERIVQAQSGKDLMEQLGNATPRLLCSLIHKFGNRETDNFNEFIKELESAPSRTVGEIFVFVDECHRTNSGKLHKTMKAIIKDAVLIGFTGTPLLKIDKQSSLEVFGRYIHTYKFNEAVEDEVVLDLMYEARDIDQELTSQEKIDEWFEVKTKGLNDFQKSELKKKWGTMQKVLSSKSRLEEIVKDIVFDFNLKPRLSSGMGNALLVASSIYEAARFYEIFQNTELKNKCGLVTSYNPSIRDIATEDTGTNTETEKEHLFNIYKSLLGDKSTETYEDDAKKKFKKEPANMKLLVVVDKLLTGFDAAPCTYLYINKNMQDHGLFQAICRVNRLDGEDKQFGYIVDYKRLFKKLEDAVEVYTSELDYDQFKKEDVDVLLKERLKKAKERLDEALEKLEHLCEPVQPPYGSLQYIKYFCGDVEDSKSLKSNEFKRITLYRNTVALIRAYANILSDITEVGYSDKEIQYIKERVDFYLKLREEIKLASGEKLDFKTYEADMRHLLDTYIRAEESRVISTFENQTIIDLINNIGLEKAIDKLPDEVKNNPDAVTEIIANSTRKVLVKEHLIDPAYFEEMSKVLDEVIKERKANAISYEQYLKAISDLLKKKPPIPEGIETQAQFALYNNLGKNVDLALQIDGVIKKNLQDSWRENTAKENRIKEAIYNILKDFDEVEKIFKVIKQQSEY